VTSVAGQATSRVIDFEGLQIEYDDRVLEPRPWTARQSRWAAELIRSAPPGPVLELCSGAGHIGLLAVTLAPRSLVCVDADETACAYLRRNAARAGIRVDVREGPMDEVLDPDERFAVVIADPPWVPSAEVGRHPADPLTAIDGGADGLDLVRACLEVIAGHLADGGHALLQTGPGQPDAVDALVAAYDGLAVREVRHEERGALVRIDRVETD
jgi:release factor glutamine methyltransferase